MKEIVPSDSRYILLTQQKWCCVPTCLQMVMLKHKIPLLPAELIGNYLGLIVPKSAKKYFFNVRTGSRPTSGFGTQANKVRFAPNKALRRLGIPLKIIWSLINKFKDLDQFRDYLARAETGDKDILVCFDWPSLFNKKEKEHWGHVCVLDKVYLKEDKVRIIDPDWEEPKWRMVKIKDLFRAMVIHGPKNSGGFWELSRR